MSVTSANTTDLNAFVTGSGQRVGRLGSTRTTAANKASAVAAACDFQHPSTPSLAALAELVTTWTTNEQFVKKVHDDLVAANDYDGDGNATVSNAVIAQSLADAGLTDAPGVVDVDAIQLYGDPPYSGFRDDPICMANGNFLLRESDIDLHGVASGASLLRTYNSLDERGGAFGPGWSSILDVSLLVEDRRITFRSPDGSGFVFGRLDDGAWTIDRRRQLSIRPHVDGWTVAEGHDRSWTFDADGTLVAGTARAARLTVSRGADTTRVLEAGSGRWIDHRRDPLTGLVTTAVSSDGREATYRYDDHGRLVHVGRDRGDTTYEVDDGGFLTTLIDADGIVTCRNTYDSQGRVLSQVEEHGRETRYEYRSDGVSTVTAADGAPPNVMVHDRRGRMTAMIDGLGHTMRLAYDDDDNLVQLVDRAGATTRFAHDERGNVVQRTDPDGLTQRFSWDALDRLVASTDRAGHTTHFHHQGTHREPVRIVHPDGTEDHLTIDEATGLPGSVTDADGVTAHLEWNRDGLLDAVVDGLGGRVTFAYDAAGQSISVDTPAGRTASVGLDGAGRVLALHGTDGDRRFEYSPAGRLVGAQDEAGTRWQYRLDGAGDLAAVADDQGHLLTFERDGLGQVIATINAEGGRAEFEYDPLGRVVANVDPLGNRSEVGYDPEGRAVAGIDPGGRRTVREFDVLGQAVADELPGGARLTRTYHPSGDLASETDAAGRTWAYELDVMGRVASATDPVGGVTTYRYTPAGRLAEVRSPLGRTTRRHYDPTGRLARIVEPDGIEVVFVRSPEGAIREVRRDDVVTAFDYDESGRRSAVAGPWGAFREEREAGLVTSIEQVGGPTVRFEYDARGLLARVADPAGIVTEFTHDRCGRLLAHTTGDATASYAWDEAGRLSAVTDPYGRRTSLGRDERGIVDRITLPDGTGLTRTFGPDGELAGASDLQGNELLVAVRDAAGRISALRDPQGELTVSEDALGRLTELGCDAGIVRYAWDADSCLVGIADDVHRITIERDAGGSLVGFELDGTTRIPAPAPVDVERDTARRIVTDEHGRTHRYDLAGRLAATTVGDATTAFEYDDLGLLTTEHTPAGVRTYRHGLAGELLSRRDEDGAEVHFSYDATGRRTAEDHADGSRTTYRWDALGRLVGTTRVDADGTEATHHIERDPIGRPMRIDGTPILWEGAATSSLLGIGDERYVWSGNQVRIATDPAGRWDRRVGDDPWGHDGDQGLRLGYRGELALDDLLFLGDRVYDTRNRTFLSRDPLPSEPGRLTYAGVYGYAWNDPVNLVDPTGRRPLSDDEYQAWKDANTKGWVQQNWKTIAKVAIIVTSVVVMVGATMVLGPAGLIVAGAVVGALQNGATAAIDGQDWRGIARSALIGGLSGAAAGGLGGLATRVIPVSTAASLGTRLLVNGGRNLVTEGATAMAQETVDSYATLPGLGGGDGTYNWDQVAINTAGGTMAGTVGGEIRFQRTPTAPPGPPPPPDPGNPIPDPPTISTVTASQLEGVNGIGPVLSQRVAAARAANGGQLSRQQLLDIDGIGDVRADAIIAAGLD